MILYVSSGIHECMWLSEHCFGLLLVLLGNGLSVSLTVGVV